MQPAKAFTLSAHGAHMPAVGYGTMVLPERGAELVAYAIKSGYRLIDTARKYGTEEKVGEGIRASGIARKDLWVTTKVTELDAREADFLRSAETSLKTMKLDYVDLLLVHWPQPKVPFTETLGALAKAKRSGVARHIGVSNFTIAMLDEAVRVCPEPQPGRVPRLSAAGSHARRAQDVRHDPDRLLPDGARQAARRSRGRRDRQGTR
jgi:diketogulonate reductase-like aldo/keto reductase